MIPQALSKPDERTRDAVAHATSMRSIGELLETHCGTSREFDRRSTTLYNVSVRHSPGSNPP